MIVENFDPYFKWLAIPPEEQPPNHYRLLGIPLFVDDPDVIDNAADARMAHVRSYQSGKRAAESQRILNEIAVARTCLLDPERRQSYDAELQAETASLQPTPLKTARPLEAANVVAIEEPVTQPSEDRFPGPSFNQPSGNSFPTMSKPRKKGKSMPLEAVKFILGSVAGLVVGYWIMTWLNPHADFLGIFNNDAPPPIAEVSEPPTPEENNPPVVPPVDPSPEVEPIPPEPEPDPPEPQPNPNPEVNPPPVDPPDNPPNPPVEPEPDPEAVKQAKLETLQKRKGEAIAEFDVDTTMRVIREIAELREEDPLPLQAEALTNFKSTAADAAQYRLLSLKYVEFVDDALEVGAKDLATMHLDLMMEAARKSEDQSLIEKATLRVIQIRTGG